MAKIQLAGIVRYWERTEPGRKVEAKTLRRIYTDAVSPGAEVNDEVKLKDAIEQAISATAGDDNIDGFQFDPFP